MRRRNLAGVLVSAWALGTGAACSKARTPEQAQARLCKAVAAGDPADLFEALDTQTRWDWMTVQKSHREAYDIILSNYPEGAERDRELRRFERGATLGSGRALFAEEAGRPAVGEARLREVCAPGARVEPGPDAHHAAIVAASGVRAPLLLGQGHVGLRRVLRGRRGPPPPRAGRRRSDPLERRRLRASGGPRRAVSGPIPRPPAPSDTPFTNRG